ncbi:hypothetical protein M0Q39_06695 [Patescibacteria group bacterium]|nr:hypothetical protein [Patescibacteria group bacterium]
MYKKEILNILEDRENWNTIELTEKLNKFVIKIVKNAEKKSIDKFHNKLKLKE